MNISDPVQLLAFGTAGLITAIVLLSQLYTRYKQNGLDSTVSYPVIAGGLIAIFAALSALHNKTGESISWLFSSEKIDTGVFEWGTVACLGVACILAVVIAKNTKGIQRILFYSLAIASFVVIGEEMSWGQWVFHWSTPEALTEINRQQETNLHNIVNPRLYDYLYYLIGYTALALSVLAYFFFKKNKQNPAKGLLGLMASGGNWLRESRIGLVVILCAATLMTHELLEEYAEFVFALAVMLFVNHHHDAVVKPVLQLTNMDFAESAS